MYNCFKSVPLRVLTLFLVWLLLCPAVLSACGSSGGRESSSESTKPGESAKEPETVYTGPSIRLFGEGAPVYQVVRSDLGGNESTKAAVAVKNALQNVAGYTPKIGADGRDRLGNLLFPISEYEILVGKTERPESAQVLDKLEPHTWAVEVVGNKIVLAGASERTTAMACEWFISHYLNAGSDGLVPQTELASETLNGLYVYALGTGSTEKYDTSATACCLQGLYNRENPGSKIYVTSSALSKTYMDLDSIRSYDPVTLNTLSDMMELAAPYIRTAVIWDPSVPATLNAATTIAGVEDGIVLTQAQYNTMKSRLPEGIGEISLVGRFDGSGSGSKKNDVYRWMIEEYLKKGRCSLEHIFSIEDPTFTRPNGNVKNLVNRDKAIYYRGFVFDLSVWEDEAPKDDLTQPFGTDLKTYLSMLETVQDLRGDSKLTEIDGFFPGYKYSDSGNDDTFTSKYKPTQVEWKAAYLFTPYGCYWNTVTENAYNRTVHMQTPVDVLVQNEPDTDAVLENRDGKVYLLIMMTDYDSAGALYHQLYPNWNDEGRGKIPLAWSYNPNLLTDYPDIINRLYEQKTENDFFVSNVGGAGWYTPSRVKDSQWDAIVKHHKYYFELADMTICPDLWDFQTLKPEQFARVAEYAPDGIGTLVANQLGLGTGQKTYQHIEDCGVTVDYLYNGFVRNDVEACTTAMIKGVMDRRMTGKATFMSVRCTWCTPTYVMQVLDQMKKEKPEWDIEVVDPYTYFRLLTVKLNQK
ncbi:MAG: hypothetical protein IKS35_07485 [Clostridia bacterium]|nr:hypothetical protein [Clostridia bacterium]